jgi:DNA recombination protein RmuC
MVLVIVVTALAGLAAGAACSAFFLAARHAAARAATEVTHTVTLSELRTELATTSAALEQERTAAAERQRAWEEARRQLAGEFAEMSAKALQQNTSQFLDLADARMKAAQQAASGDLEQRRQAIEQLLTPLREQLGRYEQGIRQLELDRQSAYTGLVTQVRQLSETQQRLQSETRNLVTALRAPATRGRWGELQLRRVVELAGMLEHCDFDEQVTATGDEGRVRPDMIVHLPGARCVVVDAKVPLQAFLDATESVDDEARRTHFVSHARQLRTHVDSLAKKAYWEQFETSPEFVVAFVPGDPLLSAALEHDPTLFEHALASHVVLATPTNLIAILRTVAAGWQQETMADKAREVQQLGRELYKRLATFGDHLARTGKGLASAVDAYNKAVGSLEKSVMPQARRFNELGVVGSADKEIPELDALDVAARQPHLVDAPAPSLELVVDDRLSLPPAAEA